MRNPYRPEVPNYTDLRGRQGEEILPDEAIAVFPFRPWVRRAGLSIVLVAAAISSSIGLAMLFSPSARYGWIGEPFVWVYIGTLWAGGLKVWLGSRHPVAELEADAITLRPLHQFRSRVIRWEALLGTEQMTGGDRMIVYFDTPRGMRFVAMNLNLVKGRRDFLMRLDARLRALGFHEKTVERSRYLSRGSS